MSNNDLLSRTLSNKSNIWLVGMKAMDARVIKNYIHLVKDLNDNFKLIDNESRDFADIVFVNVDSIEACNEYRLFLRQSQTRPILVKCSNNKAAHARADCLVQPITRKAIESLLKGITSTQTMTRQNIKPQESMPQDVIKVLVVDDSFPVRKYMEEKLPVLTKNITEHIALKLDFASSGKEAVTIIKKKKGDYDIVFLDVIMDDVDGYKICKWIKLAKDSIQVIMLTSKNSTFDKVRGKMAGCNNYLAKPPSDQELQDLLLRSISTRFENNQNTPQQRKLGI